MTIEKGQKITYADLISGVYEKIVSICGNVDGYSSSSSLRSGHTYKASYNSNPGSAQSSGLNVTATMESSSYLSTVNSSTVKSQLESFFASRGLDSKSGEYVSTRGMINFYANLAAFLSAKLMKVVSSYDNATSTYYYSAGSVDNLSNAPNLPGIDIPTTESEFNSFVTNISNDWNVYVTRYSYSITCSSSSSSSSCSSCSSSSSSSCSSSSFFIAFMRL